MGWFSKKKGKEREQAQKEDSSKSPKLPELPRLPELPDFPDLEENRFKSTDRLPSIPSNSIGEKFSRDMIKDAITGKKEEEAFDADDFTSTERKIRMMQKPLTKSLREEFPQTKKQKIPREFEEEAEIARKTEPVFIRIDKFEESLHLLEKIKKQISEIEKMLDDIKVVKEQEDAELNHWEREIEKIKENIEKIDTDIFSKIE